MMKLRTLTSGIRKVARIVSSPKLVGAIGVGVAVLQLIAALDNAISGDSKKIGFRPPDEG